MGLHFFQINAYAGGARIGIFGDIHGDKEIAERVLQQMRSMGVTHIIGTGDFVLYGGPDSLEDILSAITPITGIPREQVYLFPGNWEHETGFSPEEMNRVLRRYGQLVFETYDRFGFLEIQGERIMVSHFPQFSLPEEFLPPPQFRRRIGSQAFVMDTILRGHHPPQDVVFTIFAHNHIGGAFIDPRSGKLVINPGVLDARARSPEEPRAFAVYVPSQKQIVFKDAETGEEIVSVSTAWGANEPVCSILLKNARSG